MISDHHGATPELVPCRKADSSVPDRLVSSSSRHKPVLTSRTMATVAFKLWSVMDSAAPFIVWLGEVGAMGRCRLDSQEGAGLASMVTHWGLQTKSRDPSDHPLQLPPRSKPLGKIRVVLDKLIHPLNRQQLRPESGMARLTAAIAATVFASLGGACSP